MREQDTTRQFADSLAPSIVHSPLNLIPRLLPIRSRRDHKISTGDHPPKGVSFVGLLDVRHFLIYLSTYEKHFPFATSLIYIFELLHFLDAPYYCMYVFFCVIRSFGIREGSFRENR